MADEDKPNKSSVSDSSADPELKPERVPSATEDINPANDERSLDIGESGQFAPGGYYNQHGITESERLDLDEYTATRTPDDKKK
jgi:hypothetical protein